MEIKNEAFSINDITSFNQIVHFAPVYPKDKIFHRVPAKSCKAHYLRSTMAPAAQKQVSNCIHCTFFVVHI